MKTRIHISQNNLRTNLRKLKEGFTDLLPTIILRTYKGVNYSDRVEIVDDEGKVLATLITQLEKPLSCGARIWLESDHKNIRYATHRKTKIKTNLLDSTEPEI